MLNSSTRTENVLRRSTRKDHVPRRGTRMKEDVLRESTRTGAEDRDQRPDRRLLAMRDLQGGETKTEATDAGRRKYQWNLQM